MKIDTRGQTFGLHDSLIIPIGARNKEAIEEFVGEIIAKVGNNYEGLILNFEPLSRPNDFEVWKMERAKLFHYPIQLWVDVDFKKYRGAYKKVFKEFDLTGLVIDHIMNRRFAKILDFKYVRLIHIDRGVNSSSGRGPENEGVKYQETEVSQKTKSGESEIMYADPSDLLKILNIDTGGFPLKNLGDNLHLFYG